MTTRIEPAHPPFLAEVEAWLARTMPPGTPPLVLFTTLARDPRLFQRFMSGGLLDRGQLTLRQRELVIDRVTARCGSEYEWGVHVAFFGARVDLTEVEQVSLVHGGPHDPCWSQAEAALLVAVDELLDRCDLSDATWAALRAHLSETAVLEVILLTGFYRTVSMVTCALRLPIEPFAARFPAALGTSAR
jgi:alkylhydroperoxidase family enzyme